MRLSGERQMDGTQARRRNRRKNAQSKKTQKRKTQKRINTNAVFQLETATKYL